MRISIPYGREELLVEVRAESLVPVQRQPRGEALVDPVAAVRSALEAPLGFPPLRRALTPDDHIVIVVDEHLPHLAGLLTAVLEHVASAGVSSEDITLLCPASSRTQSWLEDLPEAFEDVRIESHDPADRRHLAYVATMKHGRRLYLNRTLVDADQVVVLARCHYDPLLGYAGAESALFPALSDEATLAELSGPLSLAPPGREAARQRQEAAEAAWLLGAPFLVQIIEGPADDIVDVVTGLMETSTEGLRRVEARWRVTVTEPVQTVLASVRGDPARQTFGDLGRALASAARVVEPGGRIILLSQAAPELVPGADILRRTDEPEEALRLLATEKPRVALDAFLWASVAQRAQIYLLSGWPRATTEELFAVPLDHAGQVQRLLDRARALLVLEDAHKTMALLEAAR
jgi:nickel-dependent lactate racemase